MVNPYLVASLTPSTANVAATARSSSGPSSMVSSSTRTFPEAVCGGAGGSGGSASDHGSGTGAAGASADKFGGKTIALRIVWNSLSFEGFLWNAMLNLSMNDPKPMSCGSADDVVPDMVFGPRHGPVNLCTALRGEYERPADRPFGQVGHIQDVLLLDAIVHAASPPPVDIEAAPDNLPLANEATDLAKPFRILDATQVDKDVRVVEQATEVRLAERGFALIWVLPDRHDRYAGGPEIRVHIGQFGPPADVRGLIEHTAHRSR